MSELTEMLSRCELDHIISYVISGVTDNEPEAYDISEDAFNKSLDKLFDDLEKMFPTASRENDELFDSINKFSSAQQRVYLKMGILIGLQLYRTLNTTSEKKTQDKELLGILASARIDNALEERLKSTPEYMATRKRQSEMHDNIKNIGLTKCQEVAVDDVVSATNLTGSEYGKAAYMLGLQDGIKLSSEIKEII